MTSDFLFSIMEMVLVKLMILSKKKKKPTKLTTTTTTKIEMRNVVFPAEIKVLEGSLRKHISFSGRHEIRERLQTMSRGRGWGGLANTSELELGKWPVTVGDETVPNMFLSYC